jgi:polyribonucleotide nucleotidyltransferase
MKVTEKSIELNGQKLTLQFGKLAQAVDTSVYATLGDTAVLVTVALGSENPNLDYFPLSVEYAEKLYAGGLIKGSRWVKREGRPSDEAVLIGRLIDRSIRPLFPKTYKKQVQVVITLLSVDGQNAPDVLACIATSAALHMSSIPWNGPISTTRIGYIKQDDSEKGDLAVNPDEEERKFSEMDLVVSSTMEKVLMIETEALMIDDSIIQEGIEIARTENKKVIKFIESFKAEVGKEKEMVPVEQQYEDIMQLINEKYADQLKQAVSDQASHKASGDETITEVANALYIDLEEKVDKKDILAAITKFNYKHIKKDILEKKHRPDGRKFDEIREVYVEHDILPRTHGSAIFQRGQTQILSIVTLGSQQLEQLIEGPDGKESKRYMHHYSDGPYTYGEAGRMGTPSRRAIGHGALAEKAVEPVLPTVEEFPYAIRVVSEIMSENGSSSQGSASGSTLALMDAGVPIKAHVAGIAVGLVSESDKNYAVLTDIIALEDFAGEMDFKVAGTKDGVTAIQLDVKNAGLTSEMIKQTFIQAKKARLEIIEAMEKVIAKPNKDISEFAPKVVVLTPPPDKIGEIIGPGGKNIRNLIARTNTEINVSDDGKVTITGVDRAKVEEAAEHINNITREVEAGEEFEGEVKRILPFGAFVEILPGKEGMVHVSKMSSGFVKDPNDVVKLGQKVEVVVDQIDNMGRINLRMKGVEKAPPSSDMGGEGRDFRGGGGRGGRSGGRSGGYHREDRR